MSSEGQSLVKLSNRRKRGGIRTIIQSMSNSGRKLWEGRVDWQGHNQFSELNRDHLCLFPYKQDNPTQAVVIDGSLFRLFLSYVHD